MAPVATRKLGIVLIASGVLVYLVPILFSLVAGEAAVLAYRPAVGMACSIAWAAVVAWVALTLWQTARGLPGARLLLAATVAYGAQGLLLTVLLASGMASVSSRVESWTSWVIILVDASAILLLSLGLKKTRVVGRWLLSLGLAVSIFTAVFALLGLAIRTGHVASELQGASILVGLLLYGVLTAAFWIALSLALFTGSRPTPEVAVAT